MKDIKAAFQRILSSAWFSAHKHHLLASFGGAALLILIAVIAYKVTHRPPTPVQIAVIMPLSGPDGERGRLILDSVKLYFQEVNQNGGVQGHPVEPVAYDDQDKPDLAAVRAKEAAASPALAVIGHYTSASSLSAGKVYEAAHIPAITASSTVPNLTADNPYYFRISIDTALQGHVLAAYAKNVLHKSRASILYSNDEFGRSLEATFADEFADEGGQIDRRWVWDTHGDAKTHGALIQEVAADIANGEGGVVVLAISPASDAKDALTQLRRTGVNPLILGGSSLGNNFAQLFLGEPEESRERGFFTNNTYIASPLVYDTSTERAVLFNERFQERNHTDADESLAKHYEAAMVVTEALRHAGLALTPRGRNDDRQKITDWLYRQNDPGNPIEGLTGPIYFDETGSLQQPPRIGRFVEDQLVSAPIQLEEVPNPALIDLDGGLASGDVIRIRQNYYWLQRVVYTGVDVNQINRVDTSKGTFTADFYMWFRYAGDSEVRDVKLNSVLDKPLFEPKEPLLEQEINGLHYSLYRIHGDFNTSYDFHDYPFDSQSLTIRLTNPRLTREQVIYAIDTFGLKLPRPDKGVSRLPVLSNWDFSQIRHESDTLTSYSTRGQPGAFHSNYVTQFSGSNTVITIKRKSLIFLYKNLLPLMLLVVVVYLTLYFPHSLLKERLMIAISAMLASAILLTAINSQLSDIGYTTAIEYGFFVYFALCIYCVLVGLITEHLQNTQSVHADRFDVGARILYPLIVLVVFAFYYYKYF